MQGKHTADYGIKIHNCGIQVFLINSETQIETDNFNIAEKSVSEQEFQNLLFIVNETAKLWLEDFSELYFLKIILFIIALINSLFVHPQCERNQVFLQYVKLLKALKLA